MTDTPLRSTWADRELPILKVALRRVDAGEEAVMLEEIRQEVGLEVSQMRTAVDALEDAWPPYFKIQHYNRGATLLVGPSSV
jgi:hypothetical protein